MKRKVVPAIRPNRIIWEHANSFRDAAILCRESGLPQPMAVNAALAIELYLKSFLALNVSPEGSNLLGFSSERGHIFTDLLETFSVEDRELLLAQLRLIDPAENWVEKLKRYNDTFVKIRYWYESGNNRCIDTEIVDLAKSIGAAVLEAGKNKHA